MIEKLHPYRVEAIRLDYEKRHDLYVGLSENICKLLIDRIPKNSVAGIASRVKNIDSLINKYEIKLNGLKNPEQSLSPLSDITDIVGVRIVCYFRDDIKIIADIIKSLFVISTIDDKVKEAISGQFGYLAQHIICSILPKDAVNEIEKEIKFEIQIRTNCMDAWARISHKISYKNDVSIPDEVKREFLALSALFYIADSQYETIKSTQQRIIDSIKQSNPESEEYLARDIDYLTFKEYITNKLPGRVMDEDIYINRLVDLMNDHRYIKLREIDDIVKITQGAAEAWDKEAFQEEVKLGQKGNKFTATQFIKICMELYDPKMISSLREDVWSKYYEKFKITRSK